MKQHALKLLKYINKVYAGSTIDRFSVVAIDGTEVIRSKLYKPSVAIALYRLDCLSALRTGKLKTLF